MTAKLRSPLVYTPCTDLWCITPYFNPAHYHTRRVNYETFCAPIRSAGIPLLTVECALGEDAFNLTPGPDVVQVRGQHILWQKERLINLGIAHLPPQAHKIAWLDGDILFTNPDWAVEAACRLDQCQVLQPFEHAIRLNRENLVASGGDYVEGFAAAIARDPTCLQAGGFEAHGHTGFAWAARRSWLAEFGLYEAFLSGNGDHYIAHALAGDLSGPCMQNLKYFSRLSQFDQHPAGRAARAMLHKLFPSGVRRKIHNLPGLQQEVPFFWQNFSTWAASIAGLEMKIEWVAGEVLHLWHGDGFKDRGHGTGWQTMQQAGFNPVSDVQIGAGGCLEWASEKPALHDWARQFFSQRAEDGD